jgi:membrane-bound lytic murein transglycosylase D
MCPTKGLHFQTISEVLGMSVEEIGALNPIYKQSYIPYSDGKYCITLPLEQIGRLVSLEDSLYQHEINKYIQPKPPVLNNTTAQNTTENNTTQNTTNTPPATTGNYEYHKVQSGETLGSIASRYGMSVSDLQRINGLNSTKIYVGQRLKVKEGTGTQTPTQNTTPAAAKKYYTVRSGDTFGGIAQRHGLSQSQLRRLNPSININRLSIGQKIRIR